MRLCWMKKAQAADDSGTMRASVLLLRMLSVPAVLSKSLTRAFRVEQLPITPGGIVTSAVTGLPGAEMVSSVPLNLGSSGSQVEGFYAAAYPNNIQKADASQFTSYLGNAVITSETGHQVWTCTSTARSFVVSQIGTVPAQPEDGIFVTEDIIRPPVPEPEKYALMLAGPGLLGLVARRRKLR